MPIHMIMSSGILPDKAIDFEEAFGRVRAAVSTVRGHISEDLLRDADTAGEYLLVSKWRSREEFLAWLASSAHDEMTAEIRPYFARRSTLRFYSDTDHAQGGQPGAAACD